jgi:hypothetical protein
MSRLPPFVSPEPLIRSALSNPQVTAKTVTEERSASHEEEISPYEEGCGLGFISATSEQNEDVSPETFKYEEESVIRNSQTYSDQELGVLCSGGNAKTMKMQKVDSSFTQETLDYLHAR